MTKIHILSDVHNEHKLYEVPESIKENCDLLIFAGDIHAKTKGLDWARDNFPKQQLLYISGNHEFYGAEYYSLLNEFREKAKVLDIHFLENDAVILNGIRFLGCTLWTNYNSSNNLSQQDAMASLNYRIADHHLIRIRENDEERKFLTRDAWELHQDSTSWLTTKLFDEKFDGKTVAVTHHGPSLSCKHEFFGHTELSGAFYSSLDNLVKKADLWICGHTHSNVNTRIGKCRLLSNQKGYPNGICDGFDENLVIEL